jgi:hypothetical protein
MNPVPLDIALRAAITMCRDASVSLAFPGDPKREALLGVLAAYHKIIGSGWDHRHARQHVSVTVPGIGPALTWLANLPYVGSLLGLLLKDSERPTIYLAPAALSNGVELMATIQHELGHVGDIRAGSVFWCLAYGVVGEVRAAAEAPCYVASMAVHARFGDMEISQAEGYAIDALRNYGLDVGSFALAARTIHAGRMGIESGSDMGGIVSEVTDALTRQGWTP